MSSLKPQYVCTRDEGNEKLCAVLHRVTDKSLNKKTPLLLLK